jgi:putative aldouronate transport system substrate-binding protein
LTVQNKYEQKKEEESSMKTKVLKLVALFAALIMALNIMAGCGSTSGDKTSDAETSSKATTPAEETKDAKDPAEDTTPITLKVFLKNELNWDTPVGREITKKTGITLDFVPIAGDAQEKLNLMLASNDMPDIVSIDRWSDANSKYIKSKAVIPLDDLMEKYGPNVKSQLGDTLKKVLNEDGHLYGIPSWFSSEVQPSPVFGFLIRMNYVKELGYYEKYTSKGYFTKDEFLSLLKDWKAKYPNINGKDTLPVTINQDNYSGARYTFMGMYAIGSYYEQDGKLRDNVYNPAYKEMFMFMNQLYREGLLDKDWPVNKTALWNEKMSNGYVLCAPDAYWNAGANSVLAKDANGNETPDNMFYPFKVVADGVDPQKTTYGPTSVLGWLFTYITSANKYPERTMKFLDYLISEEGQYITQWGPEGLFWEMKDNQRTIKEDSLEELKKDFWTAIGDNGIRKYEIVFKSGIAQDGKPYDLWAEYSQNYGTKDPVAEFAKQYLGDSAWDTTLYDNLGPAAGTPEALISTKISDIGKNMEPKIILAKTQEEASQLYDQMVADMEKAGLAKVEEIVNANFAKKKELWGN